MDVVEGVDFSDNPYDAVDPGAALSPKANRCWKPVVAAVHGMAAGGAFYWLNEADIIICSEDATFFDPHVTYGMISALEPIGLARRINLGDVLRWTLLGLDERMSAERALQVGLVTEITPRDRLWDRAAELAATIAAKPPLATQGTVKAIWESLDLPRTVALERGLPTPAGQRPRHRRGRPWFGPAGAVAPALTPSRGARRGDHRPAHPGLGAPALGLLVLRVLVGVRCTGSRSCSAGSVAAGWRAPPAGSAASGSVTAGSPR